MVLNMKAPSGLLTLWLAQGTLATKQQLELMQKGALGLEKQESKGCSCSPLMLPCQAPKPGRSIAPKLVQLIVVLSDPCRVHM